MIRETSPPIPGPGPKLAPRRDHAKEREDRERDGHRREYDPRAERQDRGGEDVAEMSRRPIH